MAKRGLQTLPHRHIHAHTTTESKLHTRAARIRGKASIATAVTQATGGFIKPEITNRQVTAGPAFPLLSPHWAFLSLYVALLHMTHCCRNGGKKRSLWLLHSWSLTVGLYTDAPAEGLYVPVALQVWIFFFAMRSLIDGRHLKTFWL